jgi:hypothetical protein
MADVAFETERKRLHVSLDELIEKVNQQGELAAMEEVLRTLGFALLLAVMQMVLTRLGSGYVGSQMVCPCGCGKVLRCKSKTRSRGVRTVFGLLLLVRSYYVNCVQHRGWVPLDQRLGTEQGMSVALEKATVLMSVMMPFGIGVDVLRRTAGIVGSQKRAYEWTYRRGMCAWALQAILTEGRYSDRAQIRQRAERGKRKDTAYVMGDGTCAGIRGLEEFKDCKSSLIFWDSDLQAMRQRATKRRIRRYLKRKRIDSHVGPKEEFEQILWNAMVEEGVLEAERIVWIADGAPWLWNLREQLLPSCEGWNVIEILDYYHAKQNLWKGAKVLFGGDKVAESGWVRRLTQLLWQDDVEVVISALDTELSSLKLDEDARKKLQNLRVYLGGDEPQKRDRFRYKKWRSQGLIVSSGAIESVNHGVIQGRFKLPGMRFTLLGINALLRLRNAYFSGTWDALWEQILRPEIRQQVSAKVEELERHYEQRAFNYRVANGVRDCSDEIDAFDQILEDAA